MANRFLVTGSMGCIGAWTIYELLKQKQSVIGFDLSGDAFRLKLLLSDDELATIPLVRGDITDFAQVERVVLDNGITHIIHLAALQVPFCRADPIRGAQVNVTGTVNVFEVAARHKDQLQQIAYASSAAVYGPASLYGDAPVLENALLAPATHYGVYKVANEGAARIYFQDNGVPSVCLRPHTIYGLGRDRGVTSLPTKAMLAAVTGQSYTITYGGRCDFQWASDAARTFIQCATTPSGAARVFNLGGSQVSIREIIDAIEEIAPEAAGSITNTDALLPFPSALDNRALKAFLPDAPVTPLIGAVRETMAGFRRLVQQGRIDVANAMA